MPKQKLKLKTYSILSDAVEEGLGYGYQRAYKYSNSPTKEQMIETMLHCVMLSLDDVVNFGDD